MPWISQDSLKLYQKILTLVQTDTQTHTSNVNTEDTFSGFQEFFLQPIINIQSNLHFSKCSIKGDEFEALGSLNIESQYLTHDCNLINNHTNAYTMLTQVEGKIPETLKGCPQQSLSCLSVCFSVRELLITVFELGI